MVGEQDSVTFFTQKLVRGTSMKKRGQSRYARAYPNANNHKTRRFGDDHFGRIPS
jgi:hypothetical protein